MYSPTLAPAIAIHLSLALSALLLGPVALWARKGSRPHRAAGYAWVTVMVGAALSALFIRDAGLPNIAGYTPIHLLVPVTLIGLARAIWHIVHGDVQRHRKTMIQVYVGACIVAGLFTLLPQRMLGQLVWHQWLGVL